MTVKLFIVKVPRWLTAGVYLLMGWPSIVRHSTPRLNARQKHNGTRESLLH